MSDAYNGEQKQTANKELWEEGFEGNEIYPRII